MNASPFTSMRDALTTKKGASPANDHRAMVCAACGGTAFHVARTIKTVEGVFRLRKCNQCEDTLPTCERPIAYADWLALLRAEGAAHEYAKKNAKRRSRNQK